MHGLITPERVWLAIGFAGQALFASRFIIQWFRSEMEGRSVIPLSFWYCSLGEASGLFVYSRNLYLIFRERNLLRSAAQAKTGSAA
jgi:lipid-A-disaccharide synthase-like uncharacterized protein